MASGDEAMRVARKALATAEEALAIAEDAAGAAGEAREGAAIGAEAAKYNEKRISRLERESRVSGGWEETMAKKAMRRGKRFFSGSAP